MIAEQPSHGYELMKAIEDRMGGSYTPSPGVMYPTLSWLEDMGYAGLKRGAEGSAETGETGRKRYLATAEGRAFLQANRATLDEILARMGASDGGGRGGVPAPLLRGMENLKLALRLRMQRGIDPATADAIAAALDAAALAVERS
jgi:DNA-binding PadR family transcriptional regulator